MFYMFTTASCFARIVIEHLEDYDMENNLPMTCRAANDEWIAMMRKAYLMILLARVLIEIQDYSVLRSCLPGFLQLPASARMVTFFLEDGDSADDTTEYQTEADGDSDHEPVGN